MSEKKLRGLLGLGEKVSGRKTPSFYSDIPSDFKAINEGMANIGGIFAGPQAIGANLERLNKAQKWLSKGVDEAKIWFQTGWYKAPDGKWRFEIPDNALTTGRLNKHEERLSKGLLGDKGGPRHKALQDAYPDFKNTQVEMTHGTTNQGSYHPPSGVLSRSDKIMATGRNNIEANSTLLHELQHGVQRREGFARGGSPEEFIPDFQFHHDLDYLGNRTKLIGGLRKRGKYKPSDIVKEHDLYSPDGERVVAGVTMKDGRFLKAGDLGLTPRELARQPGGKDLEDLTSVNKKIKEVNLLSEDVSVRNRNYNRLYGEIEARNVETRGAYTPMERKTTPPWYSESAEAPIIRKQGEYSQGGYNP